MREIQWEKEEIMKWDLRPIFASDDAWNAVLAHMQGQAQKLAKMRGSAAATASMLEKTAALWQSIQLDYGDLYVYARSRFDENMADTASKVRLERLENAMAAIREQLAFLVPELMQHTPAEFERFCLQVPKLRVYDQKAADLFAQKKHVMPQEQEALLVRMNDLGESFTKIFEDLTVNEMDFPAVLGPDGQAVQVSEAGYGAAMQNPDRPFRMRYWKMMLGAYWAKRRTLASCYAGSVKKDVYTARAHKYSSALEQALAENFIPPEVYANLVTAVRENVAPLHEYVAMRRAVLNVPELHFYDLFTPLRRGAQCSYTYAQAQAMVLGAVRPLGDEYGRLIRRALEARWIDVFPRPNKQTGAYSTGSYRSAPLVMMNFSGTLDDVFTLAHELGHSMHTWYSNHNQPPVYAEYSIFCAEVASTVNELLLSHFMYDDAQSDEERADVLDKRLTDLRSTFYRQTMFADFEQQTHRWAEQGTPLTADALCDYYGELNRIYYGDVLRVDPELCAEWARIPHFYRAFYVYQYATGISAAAAIVRRIRTEGEPAVRDYLRFLRGGSARHPIDLLRIAGVDMATDQPVRATAALFADTLEQLKTLRMHAARPNGMG